MHPFIKLLTTAILILVLLSAGCTDMGGGSVERSTPDSTSTAEPTQEPTATPIESQHLYDIKPDTFDYIKIDRDNNLFGIEIEGSKVFDDISGWETVYDDNENRIFQRETYTSHNFDLYSELQPEQARALVEKYGYPESVVMEQVDTDGDGALDTVAVRYEGKAGEFTVGLFACSVETSVNDFIDSNSFDACFKLLPSYEYCDDLPYGPSSLLHIYLEPNDERVLSIVEQLY